MKNLEKFNAETTPLGTELITRDGREVTEWYYFKTSTNRYPIAAIIDGGSYKFTKNGQYYNGIEKDELDLFIKPKVKECWVNVYRNNGERVWVGDSYNTKERAIGCINKEGYIKTIRITDEPE